MEEPITVAEAAKRDGRLDDKAEVAWNTFYRYSTTGFFMSPEAGPVLDRWDTFVSELPATPTERVRNVNSIIDVPAAWATMALRDTRDSLIHDIAGPGQAFWVRDIVAVAVILRLCQEHGICPYVTPAVVDSPWQQWIATVDMSSKRRNEFHERVVARSDALAFRAERDRNEALLLDAITRLLVIREAVAVADEFVPASQGDDEEDARRILSVAPVVQSWFWWAARCVINKPHEMDWSAHPWPWEL